MLSRVLAQVVLFTVFFSSPIFAKAKRKDVIRDGKVTFCDQDQPRHLRYVDEVYLSKKPHMDAKVEIFHDGRLVFRGVATQNYRRRIDLEGDWMVSKPILKPICEKQQKLDLIVLSVFPSKDAKKKMAAAKNKKKTKKKPKEKSLFALRNAIDGPLLSAFINVGTATSVTSHQGFGVEVNPWGHYPLSLHAGQYINSKEMAVEQGDQFITTFGMGGGILLGDKFSKIHLSGNLNQYTLTTSEITKNYYAFLPTAGFRLQMLAETYFEMDIGTHVPIGDDIRYDMATPKTDIKYLDQIDPGHGIEVRVGLGIGF